jgi:hypothetical protein
MTTFPNSLILLARGASFEAYILSEASYKHASAHATHNKNLNGKL